MNVLIHHSANADEPPRDGVGGSPTDAALFVR